MWESEKRMARRGRTSIVREVKESIVAIDKIGQSKRTARENKNSGIHSKKQKENTMSDCQNFVKWCRSEHGVKSIADLTETHYKAYIGYLEQKGLSEGHRINVETSLRLLEKGFKVRSERFEGKSDKSIGFCPEKRLETRTRGLDVRNRSYSEREVQLIRENVSSEARKGVDLMRELGLRVKEAVNVRREHIVPTEDGRGLQLEIKAGGGITKGGRHRDVRVPERFEQRLQEIMAGKQDHERLVNVSSTTLRDAVNVACKKAGIHQDGRGCHGFRHAYARERMQQVMSHEQQAMMNRILDNCKVGRKANYGIVSAKDKALWEATKEKMDLVHNELGHGKSRWELAMRYLGE